MSDFSTISPTAEIVTPEDAFDPGEIAGMRSAGWILVVTAALGVLGWLLRPSNPPLTSVVDLFLGVQLLRLRHNWRAWAMVRAWLGLAFAVGVGFASITRPGGAVVLVLSLSQAAYAASLLVLLFGVPTMRRVIAGRVVFAASVVLLVVGMAGAIAIAVLSHAMHL